jgi:hypothetical protein
VATLFRYLLLLFFEKLDQFPNQLKQRLVIGFLRGICGNLPPRSPR